MKYCLFCNNLAKRWSGHIHALNGEIIVGLCDKHSEMLYEDGFDAYKNPLKDCKYKSGCYGYINKKIEYILPESLDDDIKKELTNNKIELN